MFELPIGTKFYYHYIPVEVREKDRNCGPRICDDCVFNNDHGACDHMNCFASERTDGKYVIFKEIKGGTLS